MDEQPVVQLDEAKLHDYLNLVQEYGEARQKNFGSSFNQADFIAGAGCILALINRMDKMPPRWIFGVMAGKECFKGKD